MTDVIRPEWWTQPGEFDVTIVSANDARFFRGSALVVVRFTAPDRPGLFAATWRMREAEALSFTLPSGAKARMIAEGVEGAVTCAFRAEGWPQPPEAPKSTCPCCGQRMPT